jgi:hypothetical protein
MSKQCSLLGVRWILIRRNDIIKMSQKPILGEMSSVEMSYESSEDVNRVVK